MMDKKNNSELNKTEAAATAETDSLNQDKRRTPGAILADARAAKGLSIPEVAEQLKLTRVMVQALEDDDVDTLPPPIFTRGYLRAYCKLMELDEAQVVAPYENETATVKTLSDRQPGMIDKPARRSRIGVLMVLVVLIVAGISAAVWYLQPKSRTHSFQPNSEASTASSLATSNDNADENTDLSASPPSVESVSVRSAPARIDSSGTVNPVNPLAQPPGMNSNVGNVNSENAGATRSDAGNANAGSASEGNAEPDGVTGEGATSASAADNADSDAPSQAIAIKVGDEASWVTVRDRRNRVIFTRKMLANTEQVFTEPGEYRILIGRVDVVTVWQGGDEFDFSSYRSRTRGTAKFTLIIK